MATDGMGCSTWGLCVIITCQPTSTYSTVLIGEWVRHYQRKHNWKWGYTYVDYICHFVLWPLHFSVSIMFDPIPFFTKQSPPVSNSYQYLRKFNCLSLWIMSSPTWPERCGTQLHLKANWSSFLTLISRRAKLLLLVCSLSWLNSLPKEDFGKKSKHRVL